MTRLLDVNISIVFVSQAGVCFGAKRSHLITCTAGPISIGQWHDATHSFAFGRYVAVEIIACVTELGGLAASRT